MNTIVTCAQRASQLFEAIFCTRWHSQSYGAYKKLRTVPGKRCALEKPSAYVLFYLLNRTTVCCAAPAGMHTIRTLLSLLAGTRRLGRMPMM